MLPLVLFLAFLLTPVLEIYVIIQVGEVIGGWQTAALLLVESLLGAWIVRREGRRAWRVLQDALLRGVLPDRELADAALVLVGGVLLLTPGFVTDALGFACVLPFTRPLVRRALRGYAARRMRVTRRRAEMFSGFPGGFPPGDRDGHGDDPDGVPAAGPVIRGQVVDDDRTDRGDRDERDRP